MATVTDYEGIRRYYERLSTAELEERRVVLSTNVDRGEPPAVYDELVNRLHMVYDILVQRELGGVE